MRRTLLLCALVLATTIVTPSLSGCTAATNWWTSFKADPAAQAAQIFSTVQTIINVAELVFGQVKPGNAASRRIFEALGFEEAATGRADTILYRRTM